MIGPISPNFSSSNYSENSNPVGPVPSQVPIPHIGCHNHDLLAGISTAWIQCSQANHYLAVGSLTTSEKTMVTNLFNSAEIKIRYVLDNYQITPQQKTLCNEVISAVAKMKHSGSFQEQLQVDINQSLWNLYSSLSS